jgi:hypothetical protein
MPRKKDIFYALMITSKVIQERTLSYQSKSKFGKLEAAGIFNLETPYG